MNISHKSTLKDTLSEFDVGLKKSLGQNFLVEPQIPIKIANSVTDADGVIEIGPGAGVLTKELCKRAKKVVAVEIDTRLLPVLDETLKENLKTCQFQSGNEKIIKALYQACEQVKSRE